MFYVEDTENKVHDAGWIRGTGCVVTLMIEAQNGASEVFCSIKHLREWVASEKPERVSGIVSFCHKHNRWELSNQRWKNDYFNYPNACSKQDRETPSFMREQ